MARVVCGVDGSKSSVEALRQALAAARERGASLEVVTAWHFPAIDMLPGPEDVPTPADLEVQAQRHLDETLAAVGPEATAGVDVTTRIAQGHPAEVLLNASEDADLLVVGSRGRGGFEGLLIGSVSHQVVHHAKVPVLVARSPRK